ncbi:MAG: hypothetical protein FWE32_02885 [Oscillospiraceae bacterium]|nr:hypothetical protein [Oscillospiraceae bacterium]
MRWIQKLPNCLGQFSALSRLSFKLGAGMMVCFYIVGYVSLLTAPYHANYGRAVALFYGCLEAAPASLAAGVIAGVLGDLMLRFGGKK